MPHFLLAQVFVRTAGFANQVPIRGEQEEQILSVPVPLAHFEDRLLARNIISAVAIDEYEPPKTVLNKIFQEAVKQIEISPGRRGQRARKIQVMIGISQPHQRREKHA